MTEREATRMLEHVRLMLAAGDEVVIHPLTDHHVEFARALGFLAGSYECCVSIRPEMIVISAGSRKPSGAVALVNSTKGTILWLSRKPTPAES